MKSSGMRDKKRKRADNLIRLVSDTKSTTEGNNESQGALTEEAAKMMGEQDSYMSREFANKVLSLANTGVILEEGPSDEEHYFTYDFDMLKELDSGMHKWLLYTYQSEFDKQVLVTPYKLNVEEGQEDIGVDHRTVFRLYIPFKNGKEASEDNRAVVDIFLNDMLRPDFFIELLGINNFFRYYSINFPKAQLNCLNMADVIKHIPELEKQVIPDDYFTYMLTQMKAANVTNAHINGDILKEVGISRTELGLTYLSTCSYLLEELSIDRTNVTACATFTPTDLSYEVTYGSTEIPAENIADKLKIVDTEQEEFPTMIRVPDLLNISVLDNIGRICMQLKHFSYLYYLKTLKQRNDTDWSDTIFKTVSLPNMVITAKLAEVQAALESESDEIIVADFKVY